MRPRNAGELGWTELDIRHLLALRAVVDEGTFGKAATRLGFTQSAVSHQVAALEKIVGAKLFDRPSGPRKPILTPAGQLMLDHAEKLLGHVELAEQELDRLARGVTGTLAIGTFQSMTAAVLPAALSLLRDEAPEVEVRLMQETLDMPSVELLRRGEIDLCVEIGEAGEEFNGVLLGSDPYVAVMEPDTPEGPVDPNYFSGRPMVGLPEEDLCQRLVLDGLDRLGVSPNYVFSSYDNGAVQAMVRAGIGSALMPVLAIDPSDPGVAVRQLRPSLEPRPISVIWTKGRTLSPAAERFIEILAGVCEERLSLTPFGAPISPGE